MPEARCYMSPDGSVRCLERDEGGILREAFCVYLDGGEPAFCARQYGVGLGWAEGTVERWVPLW